MDSRLLTSTILVIKTTHGYKLHRLHRYCMLLILQKKTKHVVVSGKQDIIGVEGIDDVEEYNQYDQMNLFTDLAQNMKIIEAGI